MRPKGEIHLALLKAVGELATPERGASLREIAARACEKLPPVPAWGLLQLAAPWTT